MSIEVEGPDGTVIEFPDDTAPATIKGVMAKHYQSRATLPDGSELAIDVPEGADDATIARLGQEALNARNVRGRAVVEPYADSGTMTRPTAVEALTGAAQDFGTNLTNGFFALPDLAAQAGNFATNAVADVGGFLATGGGASSGTVGVPSDRDKMAATFAARPAPTMRGINNQLNPDAGDSNTAFLTETLGASMMPLPVGRAVPNALAPNDLLSLGRREGVRVMRSDIAPPKTFIGKSARAMGERIPFAGTGGGRAAQQGERVESVKRLLNEYGATVADDAVNAVSKDLVATRGAELGRLTAAKNGVIDGIEGTVPPRSLINTLEAINVQVAKLEGIDAEAFAPVIDKLVKFGANLSSGKTLAQIEGNRKLLGDLFADPSLAAIKGDGQKALNAIYNPLRDDMGAFIDQAGPVGAKARWSDANARLSAMAGELNAKAFKGVLNSAETTPEAAAKIIFGKTPSDMRRLYGNLSDAGKAKAQSAILYKAAQGATENGVVSPQKFANAMEAMDKSSGVFFSGADKARIDGMTRLLKATQRASEAAAMPMTGVQNAPAAMAVGFTQLLGFWPGLGAAGAIGLAARAYESGPARAALLQLGRTKPGSKAEGAIMERLARTLVKMVPTAANDVEGAMVASPGSAAASEQEQN